MTVRIECSISNTILNAGMSAFESYYDMTKGECWPYYTPEYWYTVEIAKALSISGNHEVLVENSVAEVREYAIRGKKNQKPSESYRIGGRADIVLWKDNFKPRAIIEVKKGWSWTRSFGTDLDRIAASLKETGKNSKRGGTIKYGFLVIITSKHGENEDGVTTTLNKKYEHLLKRVKKHLSEKGHDNFECLGDKKFSRYYENNLFNQQEEQKARAAVFIFRISQK